MGGPSREKAPQPRLFLSSSDSARSLEEEERMASSPRSKGKGKVPVQEVDLGEAQGLSVTSVKRRISLAVGAR